MCLYEKIVLFRRIHYIICLYATMSYVDPTTIRDVRHRFVIPYAVTKNDFLLY